MREIKFRAWSNDLGCCFYAPSESWSIAFHSESIVAQMWCSDGLVDEIPVDVIEQFTGLTDKNGNDIYEGDIVGFKRYDYKSKEHDAWIGNENSEIDDELEKAIPMITIDIDVVTMDRFPAFWLKNEKFGYEGELLSSPSVYEILGNIHEHPHLMEQK